MNKRTTLSLVVFVSVIALSPCYGATQGKASISVLLPSGRPETEFIKSQVDEFQKETGIQAQVVEVGSEEENTRLITELQAKGGSFDVVGMPYEWIPQLANDLIPIEDKLDADDKKDILKSAIDAVTINNHIYGVLYTITCPILFYRTDLLDAKSIKPPTNWQEYVVAAQKLTTADVWGTAVVAQNSDEPVVTFLGYLYQAGGDILDSDGRVIINDKNSIAALQFLVDLVNRYKVAPPGAANYNTVDITNMFTEGKLAMAQNWTYMYAAGQGANSKVKDKFAMTVLPAEVKSAAPLGGWVLSGIQYSKNPDGAFQFIHFMTDSRRQKEHALKFGNMPSRTSAGQDSEVSKLGFVPVMLKALDTAVPRIKSPAWPQMQTILGAAISSAVAGSVTPQEALDDAAAKIQEALKNQ
jgi:multiple sugar transport system substrate-binding protein